MASNKSHSDRPRKSRQQPGIVRGEPRAAGTSDASLYELVGGEKGLRNLIETFYDIVEFEDAGNVLHTLHRRGHGVAHSRIEQFDFMSGFLGGPRLYVTHHGHSDVRYMHEHVAIGPKARDAWLNCMSMAIDRVGLSSEIKQRLMEPFTRVANILVNRSDNTE